MTATSSTTSPRGFSNSTAARAFPTRATTPSWLVAEAEASGAGRPRGRRPPADAGARAGMDRVLAESPPGQIQGALPALRGTLEAGRREADPDRADHDSGGRAPRPERGRFRGPDQGLRRPAADRQPHFQAAARRHRRRDRPQRRRQDHAVPDDHRAGKARQGHHHGRRERASRLCRPVPRLARRQEERVGGDFRRQRADPARQARGQFARLLLVVQLQGRRPAEEGRLACRAASATACIWPRC